MSTNPSNTNDVASNAEPYVRAAHPSELGALVALCRRSFIDDPVMNFAGNVSSDQPLSNDVDTPGRRTLEAFYHMLVGCAFLQKGLVTVVAVPQTSAAEISNTPSEKENSRKGKKGDGKGEQGKNEKIAALTVWLPPRCRIGVDHPVTMVKAGFFRVFKGWGVKGLQRLAFDYAPAAEKAFHDVYHKKGKSPAETEADAWYLQLAATAPEEQGKGYLSRLVRDAFAQHPNETYILEATTPNSRDRYQHLGFQFESTIHLGKGHCNAKGLVPRRKGKRSGKEKGDDAEATTGYEIYAMVKWKGDSAPQGSS